MQEPANRLNEPQREDDPKVEEQHSEMFLHDIPLLDKPHDRIGQAQANHEYVEHVAGFSQIRAQTFSDCHELVEHDWHETGQSSDVGPVLPDVDRGQAPAQQQDSDHSFDYKEVASF